MPNAVADDLPEGYAYELVSPSRSQGQRVTGLSISSSDENRVLTRSVGGYADTQNLPDLGIPYITSRTPTGWLSAAIAPPAADYPFIGTYGALDWTDNLERTLWFVNLARDKGTERFTPIVRNANGQFEIAGPTVGGATGTFPSFPTGASADLRTVLVRTTKREGVLTDGTTDARSPSVESMVVSRRDTEGVLRVEQLAYRAGATMLPNCGVRLGNTTARGAVSADGSKIFFSFSGSGTCLSSTNQRIWAKIGTEDPVDLAAGSCTENCGSAASVVFRGASRDGNRVFFTTTQKLVNGDEDTADKSDLYEYDFEATGSKLRAITGSASPQGAGVRGVSRISEDGAYVYFIATGRDLAAANARGLSPSAGQDNLYVLHRPRGSTSGTVRFIATVSASDATALLSAGSRPFFTSTDGRFALFPSRANLTDDKLEGDTQLDLFRYDAQSQDLRRIWPTDPEYNGLNRTHGPRGPVGPNEAGDDGARQKQLHGVWPISDDGATVAFSTDASLSREDTNEQTDTYMWQEGTGRITMVSDGKSPVPAGLSGVSRSGDTILFQSSSPLVPAHQAGSVALFALRRGGGFPNPPEAPTPCVGDTCQGAPVEPHAPLAPPSTVTFVGPGNILVVPPTLSVKGTVSRSRVTIRIRTSAAGRLSVEGARIRGMRRSVHAPGVKKLRVRITNVGQRTLNKRGRLRAGIKVVFRAGNGGVVVKTISVTLKRPKQQASVKGQ